jgi:transcriptional regulator with XRE-family HTH domain
MKTETRFGKKVRELRIDRGWSQEQLAELADITPRTVQRVEKDQTRDGETLKAIAAAFDVTVKDLRTDYWLAEAYPAKALLIESAEDFRTAIQRAHHFYRYHILVTPSPDIKAKVYDLIDQVFADIWAMEPDEPGLLTSYVDSIREPVEELKRLGMSFFSIQQRRDIFIKGRRVGERIPMEDVTYSEFFLVPTHGCFRETEDAPAPLHRFSSRCPGGISTLLDMVKYEKDLCVAVNAIYVMSADGDPSAVLWCDTCFPELDDGGRISWQYLQEVTGFSREQLAELDIQIRAAMNDLQIQSESSELH